MGFLDKVKSQANDLKDKAAGVVDKHSDKIRDGIDGAGDYVDKKTKGKYSDKVDSAKGAAEAGLDKLDGKSGDDFPEDEKWDGAAS
jgi:MT0933-like antitoxin protein